VLTSSIQRLGARKGFFPPYNNRVDKEGAKEYQNKFKNWIVTRELLEEAGKPYYMHCGPADRGQEVTDEVLDSYEKSLYLRKLRIDFMYKKQSWLWLWEAGTMNSIKRNIFAFIMKFL